MTPSVGSLCTGYGGLDIAVTAVLGGTLAWVADTTGAGQPGQGVRGRTAECGAVAPDADHLGGHGRAARAGQAGREVTAIDALADPDGGRLTRYAERYGEPHARQQTSRGDDADRRDRPPADAESLGHRDARQESERGFPPAAVAGGLAAPADPDGNALREQPVPIGGRCGEAIAGLPCAEAAPNPEGVGWGEGRPEPARLEGRPGAPSGCAPNWGPYAGAIARWESVLGRTAPEPVDDRGRLSPAFVEWLMGLPNGHVTGVPGLTRTAQLKALGNGVVPQQAEAAIRLLLARAENAGAAA